MTVGVKCIMQSIDIGFVKWPSPFSGKIEDEDEDEEEKIGYEQSWQKNKTG